MVHGELECESEIALVVITTVAIWEVGVRGPLIRGDARWGATGKPMQMWGFSRVTMWKEEERKHVDSICK